MSQIIVYMDCVWYVCTYHIVFLKDVEKHLFLCTKIGGDNMNNYKKIKLKDIDSFKNHPYKGWEWWFY